MNDEQCPSCGFTDDDERALYCPSLWHLTGQDRIPEIEPRSYRDRRAARC